MSQSSNHPGKGVFGWLGRQVGHVRAAIRTDPAKTPPAAPVAPQQNPEPLFERRQVEELAHPTDPRIRLRRTTIDEAILDSAKKSPNVPDAKQNH